MQVGILADERVYPCQVALVAIILLPLLQGNVTGRDAGRRPVTLVGIEVMHFPIGLGLEAYYVEQVVLEDFSIYSLFYQWLVTD